MKVDRLTRVNELLRREIGAVLYRVLDRTEFDLASVTVTHVLTSSDLRTARVLISIRGHEEDRARMLQRIQALHGQIQHEIADVIVLKYTPKLTFALDTSIETGDRVLDILAHLPERDVADTGADASGSPAEDASAERA
jgi:ribosome-binding factor A